MLLTYIEISDNIFADDIYMTYSHSEWEVKLSPNDI